MNFTTTTDPGANAPGAPNTLATQESPDTPKDRRPMDALDPERVKTGARRLFRATWEAEWRIRGRDLATFKEETRRRRAAFVLGLPDALAGIIPEEALALVEEGLELEHSRLRSPDPVRASSVAKANSGLSPAEIAERTRLQNALDKDSVDLAEDPDVQALYGAVASGILQDIGFTGAENRPEGYEGYEGYRREYPLEASHQDLRAMAHMAILCTLNHLGPYDEVTGTLLNGAPYAVYTASDAAALGLLVLAHLLFKYKPGRQSPLSFVRLKFCEFLREELAWDSILDRAERFDGFDEDGTEGTLAGIVDETAPDEDALVLRADVQAAIAALPVAKARLAMLHLGSGISVPEAAKMIGITVPTAENWMKRNILPTLRTALKEYK